MNRNKIFSRFDVGLTVFIFLMYMTIVFWYNTIPSIMISDIVIVGIVSFSISVGIFLIMFRFSQSNLHINSLNFFVVIYPIVLYFLVRGDFALDTITIGVYILSFVITLVGIIIIGAILKEMFG